MSGAPSHSTISLIVLLNFTVLAGLTLPVQMEGNAVASTYQAENGPLQTGTTTNTTSTAATSSQTSSTVATTTTTTTSQPLSWDLLIPMLIIGVAAVLTVIISAVLAVTWRRKKTMPAISMICPRCRMIISPYDTFCPNCRTPLYQGYTYYPRRR